MMIRRYFALSVLAIAVAAHPVLALSIAAPSGPVKRAFESDVVVVGEVTVIEADPIEAESFPGAKRATEYRVGIVKIDKALVGAVGLTHIKVAYVPAKPRPAPVPVQQVGPGDIRIAIAPRLPQVSGPQLKPGVKGCFFLIKLANSGLYKTSYKCPPILAESKGYEIAVADVQRAMKVVANPMKALSAAKPDDRYFAAVALLAKYRTIPFSRTGPGRAMSQTDIPVDESKRIIRAVAERDDWSPAGMTHDVTPASLVGLLGLKADDGWQQPKPVRGQDYNTLVRDVFRKWAKEHVADEFVVRRYTPDDE